MRGPGGGTVGCVVLCATYKCEALSSLIATDRLCPRSGPMRRPCSADSCVGAAGDDVAEGEAARRLQEQEAEEGAGEQFSASRRG